jgi:hypothetical protein
MKNVKDEDMEFYQKHREDSLKHWRSWGSWFSWGSPVGLGLFFISLAFCYWIIMNAN